METVTRYAIQCYDPTEPHFWFILPSTYKTQEEAQDKIHILEKVEASHRIPNLRILKQRILPFTIEVPPV
jgi:hypothetical protein